MKIANMRRILATIASLLGLTLFASSANVLSAVAPQMGAEFNVSEAIFVKWTMPVQFIGFVLLCFLGGIASDKFGKKITMMCACVAMAFGCLIWISAPNMVVLYAGAIIVGMGGGVMETVGCAGLTDLHPTKSKLFTNLSQVFYCIGAISVGMLAGWLISKGVAWRQFYIALIVFSLILVAAFAFTDFPKKDSEGKSEGGKDDNGTVRKLFPKVWLIALAVFLYVFAETAMYAFGPVFMKQLGANEQISTMSIAIFWSAVVIGRICCSFLPQKQNYEPIICSLFLLAAISSIGQCFARSATAGIIIMAIIGLACSGTWPLMISMAAIRHFEYSGTVTGICVGIGALGCIFSPLTLGSIFDKGHQKLAFILLGSGFFLGFICILITYFMYKRQIAAANKN